MRKQKKKAASSPCTRRFPPELSSSSCRFSKSVFGIKIDHIDASSDALVTRAVAEARGGKVFGDVFAATLAYITRMRDQKLLVEMALPEAAAYPNNLKGSYWVATDN